MSYKNDVFCYSRSLIRGAVLILGLLATSACTLEQDVGIRAPTLQAATPELVKLRQLPPPARPLHVAVYRFEDQTGQNKPSEDFAELSRAVTQGGASILVSALKEAGGGRWFTVLEREQLGPLLEERKLFRAGWMQARGPKAGPPPIPPLLNAGTLLTGGIIGFDSNVQTGGSGARYLGIGASKQYRVNNVSVYLRAVSVKTGEVMESVVVNKTLYSTSTSAGVFSYVTTDGILELEAGTTENEPGLLALKQAFEKAVRTLIIQGARNDRWGFKDGTQEAALVKELEFEVKSAQAAPKTGV